MSALEELITKAKALQAEGHTPGQISDELGLSMETVTWLLTQQKGMEAPKDVHIDWTAIGSHGILLGDMAVPPAAGSHAGGSLVALRQAGGPGDRRRPYPLALRDIEARVRASISRLFLNTPGAGRCDRCARQGYQARSVNQKAIRPRRSARPPRENRTLSTNIYRTSEQI